MIHELAVLKKPVSAWFCLLVFGGPVALLSLVGWMGKRGWIKLADDDDTNGYRGRRNPATGLRMMRYGGTDIGGNPYGTGKMFSDE